MPSPDRPPADDLWYDYETEPDVAAAPLGRRLARAGGLAALAVAAGALLAFLFDVAR